MRPRESDLAESLDCQFGCQFDRWVFVETGWSAGGAACIVRADTNVLKIRRVHYRQILSTQRFVYYTVVLLSRCDTESMYVDLL